ncbi:MAG: TIGR02996 domain-containing protein, partial [Gemmataceae bacterium]
MDPHLPFLRAIAANPADDLPRLVYADFLEETGEPPHVARAHFIRIQIAQESLPVDSRDRARAAESALALLWQHLGSWSGVLAQAVGANIDQVWWRRGFPCELSIDVVDLVRHGRAVFEQFPIERLRLEQDSGWDTSLQDIDYLTRVTRLRVGPHFNHLHDTLPDNDPWFFAQVMRPGLLPSLRVLDLSGNLISDRWLVRFVSTFPTASFAATLEELDLSHCHT